MKRGDVILGGAAAVLGAAVLVYTQSFPRMAGGAPGPALFPQLLAFLLIGFGTVVIVQSRKPAPDEIDLNERGGILRGAIILALVAVYIVVVTKVGFVITSFLAVLAMMFLLGVRPLTAVLSTAGIVVFCVFVFEKALRVPLPPGILESLGL